MKKNFDKVLAFHEAMGLPVAQKPDAESIRFRQKLLLEEIKELEKAFEEKNLVEVADGLADVVYVAYGHLVQFGWGHGPFYKVIAINSMPHIPPKHESDAELADIRSCYTGLNTIFEQREAGPLTVGVLISRCFVLAQHCGIQLQRIFDEVHRTNMLKKGDKNSEGKVIKPEGWEPPDIKRLLYLQTLGQEYIEEFEGKLDESVSRLVQWIGEFEMHLKGTSISHDARMFANLALYDARKAHANIRLALSALERP